VLSYILRATWSHFRLKMVVFLAFQRLLTKLDALVFVQLESSELFGVLIFPLLRGRNNLTLFFAEKAILVQPLPSQLLFLG
jgi:hypothetical protein